MEILIYALIWFFCSTITATMLTEKGHSSFNDSWLGFLLRLGLGPFGIVAALLVPDSTERRLEKEAKARHGEREQQIREEERDRLEEELLREQIRKEERDRLEEELLREQIHKEERHRQREQEKNND